ncbi:hypothetical protein JGH11_15155 [Dysgonomonas sp. Marseille-P4677]|uniref:hypothetical protein n=1 Tax=Dysgonomonas sp. Marseille-P4677 TaxID=2364790 RepID=UPI001914A40A|nr:hypothetical protein [Dysgonomonas sp. Marseille-P4677]MBK5722212.1 hypothetical protein [Dysgonomonas sp. Marseille-P4677]
MRKIYQNYLIVLLTFTFLLSSCSSDDGISTKSIEGHWIYVDTKAEVYMTDPSLQVIVKDYIENRYRSYQVSYEFKNDKTYYYYLNYAEPIKGIYKMIDKDFSKMDDQRGVRNVVRESNSIFVISDMKEEVVRELNIDENKIIKATATDSFERGLHSN